MDASQSMNVVLNAQFTHPWNFLNSLDLTTGANSFNQMGALTFIVLNKLTTVTEATQSLDITVYAAMIAPKVRMLTFNHTPVWSQVPAIEFQSGSLGVSGLANAFAPVADSLFGKGTGKTVKTVGSVADAIIPFLGMLDHPSMAVNAPVDRTFSDITHGVGGVAGTRLGLSQNTMLIPDKDNFVSGVDEMNLRTLCALSTFAQTVSWSTTRASGDLLYSTAVHPAAFYRWNDTTTYTDYYANTLTYISNAFELWKGSLTIRLDFIASAIQRGRLIAAFLPGVYGTPTLTQALQNTHYPLDIRENNSFTIDLPWTSVSTYKRVPRIDTITPTNLPIESTGTFAIFVLNSLSTTSSVAPSSIDMNVYVSSGADFDLQQPRVHPGYQIVNPPPVVFQSGVLEGDVIVRDTPLDPVSVIPQPTTVHYPEDHMDLGNLLKKPSYRGFFEVPRAETRAWRRIALISGSPTVAATKGYLLHNYFSSMYRHISGPMRFSILTDCTRTTPARLFAISDYSAGVPVDDFSVGTITSAAAESLLNGWFDAFNLSQQQSFDVTMMWGSPFSKLFTTAAVGDKTAPGFSGLANNGSLYLITDSLVAFSGIVMAAFADETRLMDFIGPPVLRIVKPTPPTLVDFE